MKFAKQNYQIGKNEHPIDYQRPRLQIKNLLVVLATFLFIVTPLQVVHAGDDAPIAPGSDTQVVAESEVVDSSLDETPLPDPTVETELSTDTTPSDSPVTTDPLVDTPSTDSGDSTESVVVESETPLAVMDVCEPSDSSSTADQTDAADGECDSGEDELVESPGEQADVEEQEPALTESAEPVSVKVEPIFEVTIPDPYFYISGVQHSYLPSGGDCSGKTNCVVSATPIQDALNYAKTQILDDDTIYFEAGALYTEAFSISGWTNPLTLRPDGDGDTGLGGDITISGNSAPIIIRDFVFMSTATITLDDSPSVTLAGSDKLDDTFDVYLAGSGAVDLSVQGGEPDIAETAERVLAGMNPADDDTLVVHGTSGNDTIQFDASFTRNGNQRVTYDVVETLGLDGGGGTDTLVGPDAATTFDITGTNSGILTTTDSTLPFVSFENLSGATKVDTFVLRDAGSISGTLAGGSGSDILDYSNRTSAVTVNLTTGSAPSIGGLVSGVEEVIGTSLADTLTGDANDNVLTGNGGADVLTGNDGDDTLKVTLSGASALTVTVNGGSGDDHLTVFGTSGVDSFVVDIANRQVTRSGNQVVTYSGFDTAGDSVTVDGEGGSDTLAAVTASTYFRITDDNGGQVIYEVPVVGTFDISTAIDADANTINFGAAHGLALGDKVFYHASAGSTSSIGLVNETFYYIVPTADPNVIQLADSAENAKLGTGIVILSLGTVSEAHWLTQWERVEFAKIENLTGGTGDDTFWFANDGKLDGTFSGGAGTDSIKGANDDTSFTISGTDAGLIETTVFTSIENITGGEADDTFDIGYLGLLSGVLNAGGGEDTLNGRDLNLIWNLTDTGAGSTTGLNFSQFENLIAGDLDDIFNIIKTSFLGNDGETYYYFGEMPGLLDGAGGTDSLYGPDWKYDWQIDSANGGTLQDITPFEHIENLYGGTEQDNFIFKPGGSISGIVDGGLTGDNALDFEDQTSA
ncbi:MAG: calcium-binding protein [Chloroflexi bacterium]|nr:calcium-binding protein [Chloroflexota bacterium]